MAIEVFVLTPKEGQTPSSVLAFAKGLGQRGICSGASLEDGLVKIYMLPAEAGRYKKWDFQRRPSPKYSEDRDAVMAAIVAGSYDWTMDSEKPVPAPAVPLTEDEVIAALHAAEKQKAEETKVEEPPVEEKPVEAEPEPAPAEPAAAE